jgi:hypothetical protein
MQTSRVCNALQWACVLIVISAFWPACAARNPVSVPETQAEEPQLTAEQQREFLVNADVIRYSRINEGITNPYRLTLSDGTITHDASFQSINERRAYKELERGGEANFVDSYLYNIAAYELAKLIDLDDMLPVTVERKWQGKTGSVSWWLPTLMSEGQRRDRNIRPPDVAAYNNSMSNVRVFTELIYDTDRMNPGNLQIGTHWELYMIDFTRAFRLYHDLRRPELLERCNRELLQKLRSLDGEELAAKLGKYLNKNELEGIMARRDKIVAHFEKLVAEKGEAAVLF